MGYSVRLADVCLAAFFLLNVALELLVFSFMRHGVRWAERMRAAAGARLLLGLRLLPVTVALVAVAGLGVPSYLRYEQDASESVGLVCTLLALCGLLTLGASAVRLMWGLAVSARMLRVGSQDSGFALVGFLRPRVMISRSIREALSTTQMEAALRHERAHSDSLDNLKRLALFAAPRLLPLGRLEREWARLAEWAADDAAIAGEPKQAIALAEALVRVARLSGPVKGAALVSSLVARTDELGPRVDRLLKHVAVRQESGWRVSRFVTMAAAAVVVVASQQQWVLAGVHAVMERLVH